MKTLITGLSVLCFLFVFGATVGCGERDYVDPGEVEGVEIDLGDSVPPLGGDDGGNDDSGNQ